MKPKKLKIKYRTWFKNLPPRKIKAEIPGWAGNSLGHSDGDKPQPWHCIPFVEGSLYGLELVYPFDSECRVTRTTLSTEFNCDFSKEWDEKKTRKKSPPFSSFAPFHYGMTSCLDIEPPKGYVLRLEPHPRFFTDITDTVPIAVSGHIHPWWSQIFFVVFKAPSIGQTHIFKKGEPYAKILIVPEKITFDIKEMSEQEAYKRARRADFISKNADKIAKNSWKDYKGNTFNDKYRQLNYAHLKNGEEGIENLINKANKKKRSKNILRKFIKPTKR